jgi:glycosyltransferase EpsE
MTFFNESVYQLQRSVYSILNQSFIDLEFVIIAGNPGNADGIQFLKNTNDKRIVLIVSDEKTRMTNCLNRAIRLAKGNYIALQEADDESLPERLKKQFDFMESNPEINVLGAFIIYIDDNTKRELAVRSYPKHPALSFNRYAAIAHPTIFVQKETFEKHGYYAESDEYRHCPDYELWLRWLTQGVKFYNLQEVLFHYYQTQDNGRNKNAKKTLESVIRLKSNYIHKLHYSFTDSLYYFAERILVNFPQKFISEVFYLWVKSIR